MAESIMWDKVINDLIDNLEGGYTNDPNDKGGETNWGITADEARGFGYIGPMREMLRTFAAVIYRTRYIDQPRLKEIAAIDPAIATQLFNAGVNCGTGTAGMWLQRLLNVNNACGSAWLDLQVDGICGKLTQYALTQMINRRGDQGRRILLLGIQSFQAVHYIEIAENSPSQEEFEFGWLVRAFPE